MRYLYLLGYAVLAGLSFTSCDGTLDDDELDEDGLVPGVRQFVSQDVIDGLKELGHPIYGGVDPPDITGTYFMNPLILTSSNLHGDTLPLGTEIRSQYTHFVNDPDDSNLNIEVGYRLGNGPENPTDYSVIVGNGCQFTVFSESDFTTGSGLFWSSLMVTSGCLTDDGIKDAVVTFVLLDDPNEVFAESRSPGEGRMFTDRDGLAERE